MRIVWGAVCGEMTRLCGRYRATIADWIPLPLPDHTRGFISSGGKKPPKKKAPSSPISRSRFSGCSLGGRADAPSHNSDNTRPVGRRLALLSVTAIPALLGAACLLKFASFFVIKGEANTTKKHHLFPSCCWRGVDVEFSRQTTHLHCCVYVNRGRGFRQMRNCWQTTWVS